MRVPCRWAWEEVGGGDGGEDKSSRESSSRLLYRSRAPLAGGPSLCASAGQMTPLVCRPAD